MYFRCGDLSLTSWLVLYMRTSKSNNFLKRLIYGICNLQRDAETPDKPCPRVLVSVFVHIYRILLLLLLLLLVILKKKKHINFFALYYLTTRCCQSTHPCSLTEEVLLLGIIFLWRIFPASSWQGLRGLFPICTAKKPHKFGGTAAYQFEDNSNQCEQSTNTSKWGPGQWVAHWWKACCVTLSQRYVLLHGRLSTMKRGNSVLSCLSKPTRVWDHRERLFPVKSLLSPAQPIEIFSYKVNLPD